MNHEELEVWKNGVEEHLDALEILINDRKILKQMIEEHLQQVFHYDEIEFTKNFDVITLKWKRDVQPIIKESRVHLLGMDWLIKAEYDDRAFKIVVVEVYPWGIKTPENEDDEG